MRKVHEAINQQKLQTLAEFRYILRRFLHFSEQAAGRAGLPTQQHQLLLQITGVPNEVAPTISYLAERLGLRHHSVVELSKRCEEQGLIIRTHTTSDRRYVVLQLTPKGERLLKGLSDDHARELYELAPQLIWALTQIQSLGRKKAMTGLSTREIETNHEG